MSTRRASNPETEEATRPATRGADCGMLERVLEALEDERLTPLDLRIMLRVGDDENTIPDIAAAMGHPPALIRRASRRLVARGLLRRRRRPVRPLTIALAPTDSGASALHRMGSSLRGLAHEPFSEAAASPDSEDHPTWPG